MCALVTEIGSESGASMEYRKMVRLDLACVEDLYCLCNGRKEGGCTWVAMDKRDGEVAGSGG